MCWDACLIDIYANCVTSFVRDSAGVQIFLDRDLIAKHESALSPKL